MIVVEPYAPPAERTGYFAVITEAVSDKVLWRGGPFPDQKAAGWAGERQLARLSGRVFADRRIYDSEEY